MQTIQAQNSMTLENQQTTKTVTDIKVNKSKPEMIITAESNSVKVIETNKQSKNTKEMSPAAKHQRNIQVTQINKELRTEITKLNDEKCILINRIFSLSRKYELMKTVSQS